MKYLIALNIFVLSLNAFCFPLEANINTDAYLQTDNNFESEQISELSDKFNIQLVINPTEESFDKLEPMKEYKIVEGDINEEHVEKILAALDNTLSKYSAEGKAYIPLIWVLTSDLLCLEEGKEDVTPNALTAYKGNKVDMIIANTSVDNSIEVWERIFHHEIFHAISHYKYDDEIKSEFNSIDLACSTISNYACTNEKEEVAEAWSWSFDKNRYDSNVKIKYIRDQFSHLLKPKHKYDDKS